MSYRDYGYEPDKQRTPLRRTAWVSAHEDMGGYMKYDPRYTEENPHTLITSYAVGPGNPNAYGSMPERGDRIHYPVLDIDVPIRVVESATPGHNHLFIDTPCNWVDYMEFLKAAKKIGLIEEGYLTAALERGCTAAWKQNY